LGYLKAGFCAAQTSKTGLPESGGQILTSLKLTLLGSLKCSLDKTSETKARGYLKTVKKTDGCG